MGGPTAVGISRLDGLRLSRIARHRISLSAHMAGVPTAGLSHWRERPAQGRVLADAHQGRTLASTGADEDAEPPYMVG